jgi:hypothetical protein
MPFQIISYRREYRTDYVEPIDLVNGRDSQQDLQKILSFLKKRDLSDTIEKAEEIRRVGYAIKKEMSSYKIQRKLELKTHYSRYANDGKITFNYDQ